MIAIHVACPPTHISLVCMRALQGSLHCIYHAGPSSYHAFSADGVTWTAPSTKFYNTTVEVGACLFRFPIFIARPFVSIAAACFMNGSSEIAGRRVGRMVGVLSRASGYHMSCTVYVYKVSEFFYGFH